ncbi:MAG: hypothetical protein VB031_03530 [Eubacteriaceae bacterium]|nr:hypothetical protein [Eubacteriaceae bacterium]
MDELVEGRELEDAQASGATKEEWEYIALNKESKKEKKDNDLDGISKNKKIGSKLGRKTNER